MPTYCTVSETLKVCCAQGALAGLFAGQVWVPGLALDEVGAVVNGSDDTTTVTVLIPVGVTF
jgi:hypothetical protein